MFVLFFSAADPNPYDKLPSYWSTYLSAAAEPTLAPLTIAPAPAPAAATVSYVVGITIAGGVDTQVWASDPLNCDAQCKRMAGCLGWAFDMCGSGSCWLKTVLGTRTARTCRASLAYGATSYLLPADSNLIGRFNFGLQSTAVPTGFIADYGLAYGTKPNGMTYGWNANNVNGIERKSTVSPSSAFDSFLRMQVGGWIYHWEISLPAGYYSVRVVAGDPVNFECQDMSIESVPSVRGCGSASTPWVDFYGVVAVTDGRLGITNTPQAWSNNKLNFVELARATGTVVSTTLTMLSGNTKRNGGASGDMSDTAFVQMLARLSGHPENRFKVLSRSTAADTETFDYIVLDEAFVEAQDNSVSSTAVATNILAAAHSQWSLVGISDATSTVVSEQGQVPEKYNPRLPTGSIIAIAFAALVVVVIGVAALTAFVLIRRYRQQKASDPTAPTPIQKRPSLASLLTGGMDGASVESLDSARSQPQLESAAAANAAV